MPPVEYRETPRTVHYSVADLTGNDKAGVADLAALIQKLVAPDSWQAAGGRGSLIPDRAALVVVQSNEIHQQILTFCEKLRTARHKPLRSHENPDRFALATQLDRAKKMLDQPITANFHEPAPLATILAFLADVAGIDIVVDRAALATAETSDRVETSLTTNKQPLGAALSELLQPLGLTIRTIGSSVLQVTTREAAEERLGVEFYRVDKWLAKGISGQTLAERLKARVAPSSWSDVGGPAEVSFDPPSQCLIVLQSQPAQAAIEQLLAAGPPATAKKAAEGVDRKSAGS